MTVSQVHALWQRAGGGTPAFDREEYRRLLLDAGLLVPRTAPPCAHPEHGTCGCYCPTCGDGAAADG